VSIEQLPTLSALLNATTAVLLLAGFGFIRRQRIRAHKISMGLALLVSVCFLVSYIIYHAQVGSRRFAGEGWIRPAYFALLLSHTVLAASIVPLALVTLARALRGQFDRHKRLARWTLPLWLYVSVTGIVIYWMLYHLYRAG
jgi:putative membrane protein